MRLREFVDALVDAAYRCEDPDPRVFVRWYTATGERLEREIEMVYGGRESDGPRIVLHAPNPPQEAHEPGAGDVCDESDAGALDVELVLEFATGDRGCYCREGVCMTNGTHPECRERLKSEQHARVRAGSV